MPIILIITIVSAAIYLICDAIQKYAAVQELARLCFATAALALFLGGFK